MPSVLMAAALLLVGAGGLAALAAGRRPGAAWWAVAGTGSGSLAGLIAAVGALHTGQALQFGRSWPVPGGDFALTVDPLSACFLLPLLILAPLCAVYGRAYLAPQGQRRSLGPHWFFYCALVAAMILVLTAANALLFLAAWEVMALTSFFLVAFDHQREEVRRAAWLYLLACHLGGACLLILFLLAGKVCGSLQFADFGPLAGIAPGMAFLLFFLALAGFGSKAGLFPLHVWLPDAHPAAPSHVSALLSGAMVNTGIYGILRILTLLPHPPAWWGGLIALLGMLGALFGIAMAASQTDVKRCLAYSTVENVGIVFLGLGLGIYGAGKGQPGIAALGFTGGLLHLWNHSLFKGLLFLGAGSLVHATGSRDLSRMGGLLRRMPVTATLMIAGSLAITALPPMNGLVSEWLVYVGLLRAGLLAGGFGGLAPLLLVGLLGATGALAVVVFTRLVGIALLGEPRSPAAEKAHESPLAMTLPMHLLLAGCVALALAPQFAGRLLTGAVRLLAPTALQPALELLGQLAHLGRWAVLILLGLGTAALVLRWWQRLRPPVRAGTWGCGFAFPSSRMSYTAGAFAEFAQNHLLPAPLRPKVDRPPHPGLFPAPGGLAQTSSDPLLVRWFQPFFTALGDRAVRLRWLQQGRLPVYLFYIFLTCFVLMAWIIAVEQGWGGR